MYAMIAFHLSTVHAKRHGRLRGRGRPIYLPSTTTWKGLTHTNYGFQHDKENGNHQVNGRTVSSFPVSSTGLESRSERPLSSSDNFLRMKKKSFILNKLNEERPSLKKKKCACVDIQRPEIDQKYRISTYSLLALFIVYFCARVVWRCWRMIVVPKTTLYLQMKSSYVSCVRLMDLPGYPLDYLFETRSQPDFEILGWIRPQLGIVWGDLLLTDVTTGIGIALPEKVYLNPVQAFIVRKILKHPGMRCDLFTSHGDGIKSFVDSKSLD